MSQQEAAFNALLAAAASDTSLKGKKIAVTGARGQLGIVLLARLLAAGAEVTAISRKADNAISHPSLSWVACDVSKPPGAVIEAQYWLHAAPLWLLADAANGIRAKRVIAYGSTSSVGKSSSTDESEKRLVAQLLKGEDDLWRLASERGWDATLFRPTLVYGLGLDANISRIARMLRRFKFFPIATGAEGLRQPVHVEDLAEAALQALDNKSTYGKSYDLSGGETISYRNMVQRVKDVTGGFALPIPLLSLCLDIAGKVFKKAHVNGEIARRMGQDLVFNHDSAIKDFGYSPRPFRYVRQSWE